MATQQKFGIGQPARRKEDAALIRGEGRYVGDIAAEGAGEAYVLRAPYAHARFTVGDLGAARSAPGVLLVLTAADIAELGPLPCNAPVTNEDGSVPAVPFNGLLQRDTVRHVGDAVAFIVAETVDAAKSAAELIEVDYEPLPVIVDPVEALKEGAPVIWPEIGSNLAVRTAVGSSREDVDAAFAKADRIVRLDLTNNRLVTNYMETRGILASYDAHADRYTITLGTQGSHGVRAVVCSILKVPEDRMRVVTPDVGGGFGTKMFVYREYPLACFAAKALGRPVRWTSERAEHFVADSQGRDNVSTAEVALDAEARFLAVKVDTIANMGAYLAQYSTFIPWVGAHMVPGCYATPVVRVDIRSVFTNTVPVDAYRGAGRPEAAYLIERLVDKVAAELRLPREEVRRRNFITPDQMPFKTPTGRVYDSGEFAGHMGRAMEVAGWAGFEARRREAAKAGRLRGIGMATYIEACAGGSAERAQVTLDADGKVSVTVGTQTNGQGHITAYAQLVAEHLGLPLELIDVHQGDTDRVLTGGGTGGSRSIPIGGAAVHDGAVQLAERIKARAADMLEAAAADLEIADGAVRIAGTDRSASLAEIASKATSEKEFSVRGKWMPPENTYPNGTHICELEVEPETGRIEILAYVVVDDFGATLNPLLLEGQVHGGVVQGIGQALLERTVYEPDTGQLLTATLQDYCMPRADDLPNFHFETRNVPCTTQPLGMKGAGEAGTIGACPAVMNALVDALKPITGLDHFDMPATPEAVWALLTPARPAAA